MMYGWNGGWGLGGWILMGLLMLIFWGGVITVVVLLIRRGTAGPHLPGTHQPGPYGEPADGAERILNERFARGEIDETELLARRAALRRRDQSAP